MLSRRSAVPLIIDGAVNQRPVFSDGSATGVPKSAATKVPSVGFQFICEWNSFTGSPTPVNANPFASALREK